MPDVLRVAEILVSHAARVHGEDVAIIACYGSRAKGTACASSDLDIFYIPDDGKAGALSSQFVLDGLPYDFWPVSWSLAEAIANARSSRPWAVSASLIADAKVLHHRSEDDLGRFNALKARIEELTRPESRGIMVGRALDEFRTTLFQLGQMRLAASTGDAAGMHWAGWKLAGSAVNCLALINQTYFTKGWGRNLSQVLAMRYKPAGLERMLRGIMVPEGPDAVLAHAERLAAEVRGMLLAAQASVGGRADPREVFRDFYFFVVEYVGKIVSACERRDEVAAAAAAFHLQDELCQLMNKVERGFCGSDFNLLGEYAAAYEHAGFPDLAEPASRADLATLASRAKQLGREVQEWFARHSIELNVLASEADLQRFLNQRDPG